MLLFFIISMEFQTSMDSLRLNMKICKNNLLRALLISRCTNLAIMWFVKDPDNGKQVRYISILTQYMLNLSLQFANY